jgi:proteasome alpha subunit
MYTTSKAPAMAYDRAITVFSPEGKLYQVEYAAKIIDKGTPALAVKYKEGIVFLADLNFESKLLISDTLEKVFKVDDKIYLISAGMAGDARRIVEYAREMVQENRIIYGEPLEVPYLAKKIGSVKQAFTQYGGMRPYGVSFIIVGKDSDFHIYETEPSGSVAEYKALAIGRSRQKAMSFFEKNYKESASEKDAVKLCINALKQIYDKEQVDLSKVKVGIIDNKKSNVYNLEEYLSKN